MLRIANIVLPIDHDDDALKRAVLDKLHLPSESLRRLVVVKKSVDARMRNTVVFLYTVDVALADEGDLPEFLVRPDVSEALDDSYRFFVSLPGPPMLPPIVVGAGPCGLFGALLLARLGLRPIVIERGPSVRDRIRDVQRFWREGLLNPESNALFGEGGAGTFSDGKLTTQIKDREHRRAWILRELVNAGAPPDILYHYRPHIGTDNLVKVVENLRNDIISRGGEFRFNCRVTGLTVQGKTLRGVIVDGAEEVACDCALLAVGHSARDVFDMLHAAGVSMKQKPFSIGARIEHPQRIIDQAQYGAMAGHPRLGAADYRLAHHCANGRGVYTFCMCPGGEVIASGSEEGGIVTNGMSCHARNGANANSGLLVGVGPEDYGDAHPLAGVAFQRRWEQAAFALAGGGHRAPAQLVGDMLRRRASTGLGDVRPTYRPGVVLADLRECLPNYVTNAWREALPVFARRIRGFDMPDAVLTGVETRSSSPVRIERDEDHQSTSLRGLYPAGEGAGYAGGIISSAVDGMRAAEHMARALSGNHQP